ncbi:hypothetical protein CFC21_006753 [Triticum aestivum]|uniref:Uncharacterized protein n=2 Tax=Triticum aestivum TaxID=4565 RepID=A0A9R1DCN0_WHEAT|nr:hypothetical protein CFC21_006753 [Triticum aestivum]
MSVFLFLSTPLPLSMWTCFLIMLKQWERKYCKPNNCPMPYKMHVRVSDTVQVITGHENSKVGEVDLNLKSKHNKCIEDELGEIVMKNMMSRVGNHLLEDGTKVHYLKKIDVVMCNVDIQVKVFNERDS